MAKPVAQSSFSNPKKSSQNIQEVIYNDKSAQLNPNRKTDYSLNFKEPNKEDYRKKRTETYFADTKQTMTKNTKTEYTEFISK